MQDQKDILDPLEDLVIRVRMATLAYRVKQVIVAKKVQVVLKDLPGHLARWVKWEMLERKEILAQMVRKVQKVPTEISVIRVPKETAEATV